MVEMLISLSIFGIITAFAMANFRAGQQGDELRLSARQVASFIRRARTQTVAGYEVNMCHGGNEEGKLCLSGEDADCNGGTCEPAIPPAYGINISAASGLNREVRIFADINDNQRYDDGEALRFDSISPGPFVELASVSPADVNELDIVFTPPKPVLSFNGTIADGIATVELKHANTNDIAVITINRVSGLISVD